MDEDSFYGIGRDFDETDTEPEYVFDPGYPESAEFVRSGPAPLKMSKAAILSGDKWRDYRDYLTAVLDKNERYTDDEIGAFVDSYLYREVK